MTNRDNYPKTYRANEINKITSAVESGESVLLMGLSGSGKSNLIKFLVEREPQENVEYLVVDCNRFNSPDVDSLLKEIRSTTGNLDKTENELTALLHSFEKRFVKEEKVICVVIDRFEIFQNTNSTEVFNQLRVLRDRFKYKLTDLLATRYPLKSDNELAELFFGNTIWLGSLNRDDAIWNANRYAKRKGDHWSEEVAETLIDISEGYPSLLRGVCEAYWAIQSLDKDKLIAHDAIRARVREFWDDQPDEEVLKLSGLNKHPILSQTQSVQLNTDNLTAKEHALLQYLTLHKGSVCSKDDLVRAIWAEDILFEKGVRDENLAQLIRRLRKKIEPDPAKPRLIQTVPGRGYRYTVHA